MTELLACTAAEGGPGRTVSAWLLACPGFSSFFCSSVSRRHIWNTCTAVSFLCIPTFHLDAARRGSACQPSSPTRFSLPLAFPAATLPPTEAGRGRQAQCQMGRERGVGRHARQTHSAVKTRLQQNTGRTLWRRWSWRKGWGTTGERLGKREHKVNTMAGKSLNRRKHFQVLAHDLPFLRTYLYSKI